MISAFTITTNCLKNQYPVIESIKSIVDKVDEVIVVDGHSTDGTLEAIKAIGNDKIRIVQDKDTKWEDNWVYWRMGKNWARGFDECKGDWIIKFDTDYIFEDNWSFRTEFKANSDLYTLYLDRMNFQTTDRFFFKKLKTFAVNKKLCKDHNVPVRWGYDLVNWGLCDEAIIYEKTKDKLLQGELLSKSNTKKVATKCKVFNYGYCFRDEIVGKDLMYRNMRAFYKQSNVRVKSRDVYWEGYKKNCLKYFEINKDKLVYIKLEEHPSYIRDRIKNLTPDKQGYNLWGRVENKYYA